MKFFHIILYANVSLTNIFVGKKRFVGGGKNLVLSCHALSDAVAREGTPGTSHVANINKSCRTYE